MYIYIIITIHTQTQTRRHTGTQTHRHTHIVHTYILCIYTYRYCSIYISTTRRRGLRSISLGVRAEASSAQILGAGAQVYACMSL